MKASVCAVLVLICFTSCVFGATYKWAKLAVPAPAPEPRYHHGFAVINNTGVLVAGLAFQKDAEYLSDTWMFNFTHNTWMEAFNDTKPLARAYSSLSAHHDRAVMFAGVGPNYLVYHDMWTLNVGHRYQSNQSWNNETYFNVSRGIATILPRQFHASASIGGKVYIFGGHVYAYDRSGNDLIAYDFSNKTWSVVVADGKDGPSPRQGHILVAFNDSKWNESLLVFGGYSDHPDSAGYNDVWQFVVSTKTWHQLVVKYPPPGRYSHAGALHNNTLIIYGGLSTSWSPSPTDTYFGDVWALTLNGGGSAATWTQIMPDAPTGPGKRQGHTVCVYNNTFYTFAGYQQYVGLTNDVWVLSAQ